MQLEEKDAASPRSSASLKRSLVSLNTDLDIIKSKIQDNRDYGFYKHSIYARSLRLTPIEATILYLEDRRFFDHRGIELRSFLRLAKRALKGKRLGALSTIDQQVVRICTKRRERTLSRKFRELILAYAMNFHCSKKNIFDYYIHYCYLGYKLEGVQVTARTLFGIDAKDLDWEQSALVASLLPLPMPKLVRLASSDLAHPKTTGQFYITLAENLSPKWADRIKYRYKEALNAHDFMAKSLCKR